MCVEGKNENGGGGGCVQCSLVRCCTGVESKGGGGGGGGVARPQRDNPRGAKQPSKCIRGGAHCHYC